MLATVIVAAGNLRNTWGVITTGMRVGWLELLTQIREPTSNAVGFLVGVWRNFGAVWELVKNTMKLGWLEFMRDISDRFTANLGTMISGVVRLGAALTNPASAAIEALGLANAGREANQQLSAEIIAARATVAMGSADIAADIRRAQNEINRGWFSGTEEQLDVAREAFRTATGAMGDQVEAMVARWRRTMAAAPLEVAIQASPQSLSGLSKAISGHESVTFGSDKAFSLLYGSRGTQDYYQQQTAEESKKSNSYLERLVRDFASAPAIRRARV